MNLKDFMTVFVAWLLWVIHGEQEDLNKLLGLPSVGPGPTLPECEVCTLTEVLHEPGIGFDLNMGYANVAIQHYDGTIAGLIHVTLPQQYTDLMLRWSPPYVYRGPPFDSLEDEIKYDLDLASRRYRRLRNLPSTVEIDILSQFLSTIKNYTLTFLPSLSPHLFKVLPSSPPLPNISQEDLREAFTLAGIALPIHLSSVVIPQGPAAWAGLHRGLCTHFDDFRRCLAEEREMGYKEVLLVSFTTTELRVSKLGIWGLHSIRTITERIYPSLGYNSWISNPLNNTFWDDLGYRVFLAARVPGYNEDRKIDDLVIIGEKGDEKMFLDAVWKALGDLDKGKVDEGREVRELWKGLQVEGFEGSWVVAKGAAEVARREQNLRRDCVDGAWCKDGGGKKVGGEKKVGGDQSDEEEEELR